MRLLIRLLVTGALFALILRTIDLGQMGGTLTKVAPGLLTTAVLLQLGSTALAAYRWHLLMRNLHFGQSMSFYLRSYFKATFFNQGLPTSIGGDALRVLDVARQGFRKRDALCAVALDRIVGLVALLLLNMMAHAANPDLLPQQVYYFLVLLTLLGLTGFLGIFLLKSWRWLDSYPRLVTLKSLSEGLHQALWKHRLLLTGTSLLVHLLTVLCLFTTGWALGLHYDLMTYLVIAPPALLFTVIPISLAGWGAREGALVALFSVIGADKAAVLAMSILYGLILIVVSLPGLLVYLGGLHRYAVSELEGGDFHES